MPIGAFGISCLGSTLMIQNWCTPVPSDGVSIVVAGLPFSGLFWCHSRPMATPLGLWVQGCGHGPGWPSSLVGSSEVCLLGEDCFLTFRASRRRPFASLFGIVLVEDAGLVPGVVCRWVEALSHVTAASAGAEGVGTWWMDASTFCRLPGP